MRELAARALAAAAGLSAAATGLAAPVRSGRAIFLGPLLLGAGVGLVGCELSVTSLAAQVPPGGVEGVVGLVPMVPVGTLSGFSNFFL